MSQQDEERNMHGEILEAVARGWCHKENAHKQMDAELAKAIAHEVERLIYPASSCIHGAPYGQPCDDCVICPHCCHQFRAIPVNVQKELRRAPEHEKAAPTAKKPTG